MLRLCRVPTVLAMLVTIVTAAYNSDFCNRNIGNINSTGQGHQRPIFFDDFYVFSENKNDQRTVFYTDTYYSAHAGLAYNRLRFPNTGFQIWLDTQFNEVMVTPLDSKTSCQDTKFDTSQLFGLTRAMVINGSVQLADPFVLFGWDAFIIKNISYLGPFTSRGINTQRWTLCEYYAAADTTYVITWDIVDATMFQLPVVTPADAPYTPVLPISASILLLNSSDYETRMDVDYTHFARITPDDWHFQVPADMVCANKPNSQKSLPIIPEYFRFRAEQITIADFRSNNPGAPSVTFTQAEYRKSLAIFVQDYVSTPIRGSPNDKSYSRVVDDYNTGVTYSLDLTSGACYKSTISPNRLDAYQMSTGLVRMRTSDEFFDLDSKQYQYMGRHRVRDIDCDTWTAYMNKNQPDHLQNTLYTWYFASADWQKANSFRTIQTIPVLLQIETDTTQIQFHVYEFSTAPNKWLPDVSTCYITNNTMNVELFLKGRLDRFYTPDPWSFRLNFLGAVMGATYLASPLRITDIDVQPANNNEMVVRFKLLEQPNVAGDVGTKPDKLPSKTILDKLTAAVNSGQFYVDIGDDGKVTVFARQGSVAVTENKGRFQYVAPASNGATYSPGSMAGIAIGMLVSGLLIGAVIIFLVKKFRRSGDDTIAMSSSS